MHRFRSKNSLLQTSHPVQDEDHNFDRLKFFLVLFCPEGEKTQKSYSKKDTKSKSLLVMTMTYATNLMLQTSHPDKDQGHHDKCDQIFVSMNS